jgi:hypothetical protein
MQTLVDAAVAAVGEHSRKRVTGKKGPREARKLAATCDTFATELANFGEFYVRGTRTQLAFAPEANRRELNARMESARNKVNIEGASVQQQCVPARMSAASRHSKVDDFRDDVLRDIGRSKRLRVKTPSKLAFISTGRLPDTALGSIGSVGIERLAGLAASGEVVGVGTTWVSGGIFGEGALPACS